MTRAITGVLRLAVALAVSAGAAAGCKDDSSSHRASGGPAELKAEPNPLPPGAGPGKTVLKWRSGVDTAQLYVSVDGRPEKKVAEGHRGEKEVDWIHAGKVYQFTLYHGENRQKPLASLTVKMNAPARPLSTAPPRPAGTASAGTSPGAPRGPSSGGAATGARSGVAPEPVPGPARVPAAGTPPAR